MFEDFGYQFYACGRRGLPESIRCEGERYELGRVLKSDFFAETGLYERRSGEEAEDNSGKVVLKVSREEPFLGFPMAWLGRILCEGEVECLERLGGVANVPRVIERLGRNGFVYGYIEGRTLDERPEIPEGFFEELGGLLEEIHRRDIVYLDLNKRSNVIVGKDGRPGLIDFQIARHVGGGGRIFGGLRRRVRRRLQREDWYHLFKHKRWFARASLTDAEREAVERPSAAIRAHRAISRPLRVCRRLVLGAMYRHKIIPTIGGQRLSPENDPRRFCRERYGHARRGGALLEYPREDSNL